MAAEINRGREGVDSTAAGAALARRSGLFSREAAEFAQMMLDMGLPAREIKDELNDVKLGGGVGVEPVVGQPAASR